MHEHWLETYKSLVTVSIEAFKFSALANGGAAVALLAYVGNVAGKNIPMPDMRWPMFAFLCGVVACGLAMVFAYLTQLKLLNEIGRSENPVVQHSVFLWISIFLFVCSLIAFGFGSLMAVLRFQ